MMRLRLALCTMLLLAGCYGARREGAGPSPAPSREAPVIGLVPTT